LDELSRLEGYVRRGELVQAFQEAQKLLVLPDFPSRQKGKLYRLAGRASGELFGPYAGIKLLELSVPWALRAKDWDTLGAVRADLGTFWLMIGDYSNAVEWLQSYLLDYQKYDKAGGLLGHAHYNLALAFRRQLKYAQATEHYRQALEWSTRKGFTMQAGVTHQNLAWLYCLLHEPDLATAELDVAETFSDVCGEGFKIEQMLCRAFVLRLTKEVKSAIKLVCEVLEPKRAHATSSHRANAAWIGGSVALDLREYDQAVYFADMSTKYALEANDTAAMSQASKLKAEAVRRLHRGDQAAQ
jgi:tetratricopeptide (TPR) repeat protein